MVTYCRFLFLVGLGVSSLSASAFEGLGILGDSSSTAAATHPNLSFDAKVLWDAFNGTLDLSIKKSLVPPDFQSVVEDSPVPPVRLGPSGRENDGNSGWIWHHVMQKISAETLEAHSLSYGYLVGRRLGVDPRNILIAGENGATTRQAWVQASRLIHARDRDLPSHIIMLYTGNDLCGHTYDEMTEAKEYGTQLLKGMKYLVLNGHSSAQGTKIFVPAFLPVTTLLHEPSILEKKILLHGEQVSCREARERLFAAKTPPTRPSDSSKDRAFDAFAAVMPPSPVLYCPTLFSQAAEDATRQSMLANRIRAYREIQKQIVDEFNNWRGKNFPAKSFEAYYIDATASLKFEGDDVAGDCFHLSPKGQGKIANAVLAGIRLRKN